MFRVITIATRNFFAQTRRLAASLLNSGNDCRLTVFCDEAEVFGPVARAGRCAVRELREIKTLGVHRAKFTAYATAFDEGDFLYLDSDVIVLQPIEELTTHIHITGCHDDLSSVRGIPDTKYPWLGDPDLENRQFINSGVFYAPTSRSEFFEELRRRSLDDVLWNRYILPGTLYDNSFLCAHFNLLNEPVEYVDGKVYNWQGFVVQGRLQVERCGKALINCRTGQMLKIAHFAGVKNPDAAMCTWPVEVTSLLSGIGSSNDKSHESALVDFLGALNHDFDSTPADPIPGKMLNAMVREAVDLVTTHLSCDYSQRGTYLADPQTMISLAYSSPPANYRWNGLACGGAYLDAEEYNFVLRVIENGGIRTAIETGAGETSILLRSFGVDALSIEAQQGPWLERAREHGCRCALLRFNQETAQFDPVELRQAVDSFLVGSFDLLFIDSPPGTYARSRILDQIALIATPKYVLMHDALRDSENIFGFQQRFGLRLAAFLPSARGLALFEFEPSGASAIDWRALLGFDPNTKLNQPRVQLELADDRIAKMPEGRCRLYVTVKNAGAQTLSSHYFDPICLSYHLLSRDHHIVLWDGLRTPLPFDILPGSAATFEAVVALPTEPGNALLCLTLLQEGVCWFDACSSENRLFLQLNDNGTASLVEGSAEFKNLE